jgi:hypothetical protein
VVTRPAEANRAASKEGIDMTQQSINALTRRESLSKSWQVHGMLAPLDTESTRVAAPVSASSDRIAILLKVAQPERSGSAPSSAGGPLSEPVKRTKA